MYLIYFYSNISNEIIPKIVVNENNIEKEIMNIIYDIIIFEEGKKKADSLSIFKQNENVLFDGLDDGLYILQKGNKYMLNKKITKTTIYNGWLSSSSTIINENMVMGYVSFLKLPEFSDCNKVIENNSKSNIKMSNNDYKKVETDVVKKYNGMSDVITELKTKFKLKNA
jgi:hypothetical protein